MSTVSRGRELDPHLGGRIEWVDMAKGIGIVLVVFGHSLGGMVDSGMMNGAGWSAVSEHYIYIFHMPLFFFLAGLFVARSAHRTLREYLLNKASVIVYPYILWSLLEGATQVLASRFTNNHFYIIDLIKIIYQPIDQYWFLYVIFLMYMAYWFLYHRGISNNTILLFAIMLCTLQAFKLNIATWDVFSSFSTFLIYFALGAKAAEISFFSKLRMLSWISLAALTVLGYVLIAAAVAVNLSDLPLLHTAFAMAGTIATITLAMLLSSSSASSSARILGIYSLEIYVAHTIFAAGAQILMHKALGYSGPLLHVIVGTAAGICFPILLAKWGPKVGLPYLFTWSRSRTRSEMSAINASAA